MRWRKYRPGSQSCNALGEADEALMLETIAKIILLPLLAGVLLYGSVMVADHGRWVLSVMVALTGALGIAYFYEFY